VSVKLENIIYYDVHEVAEIFNCSTRTIKRYVDSGKLKGNKLGRTWYFTEQSIKRYIEERNFVNSER